MKLLVKLLLCLFVITSVYYSIPSFADTPANPPKTQASSEPAPVSSSPGKDDKYAPDQTTEVETSSLMDDFSDPAKRLNSLGLVAEILGVSSGLILITGAILAACAKRFGLVKLMLAIGVVGGIAAVAAPGIISLSGDANVGFALTALFLIMYIAVFFLPIILAFKENASKKWMITMINLAGCVIPGAGLIALYMVLKAKPVVPEQAVIQ